MADKGNNAKKIAAGAVLAGVAGYVAGILTAPKSGKETRKDIKNAAAKTKVELEKRLKALSVELGELMEQAKKQGADLKDKAREGLDEALTKAGVTQQQVKEILSAVRTGEAADPELKAAVRNAERARDHLKKYIKKA